MPLLLFRSVALASLALMLCACNVLVDLDGLRAGASTGGAGSTSASGSGSGSGGGGGSGGGDGGGGASPGCDPGLADCDGVPGNGCEVVLATDHDHCGMCGRNCGDGDCVAGACPPLLLAGGQGDPHDIAYRDGAVHWVNSDDGALMRCEATGCGGAPEKLGESGYWSFYLDLDETHVYWNNNGFQAEIGGIWRCPREGGCPAGASPWIADVSNPTQVGVGPDHVYWHTNDGVLQRAAKATGIVETVMMGVGNHGDVQVDNGELFWTESSLDRVRGCVLESGGCGEEILNVSGAWQSPEVMVVDATHVYFATDAGNDADVVARVDRTTGALETLVSTRSGIRGLALSQTHIYFGESTNGTLQKVPKAGGSLQVIADDLGDIHRVAIGGGFAFVTIGDSGSVWRFSW